MTLRLCTTQQWKKLCGSVTSVLSVMALVLGINTSLATASPAQGHIISISDLPRDITVPHADKAYRITYGTVGIKDQPALSSAAVYLPPGQAPEGGWPVIAWAHGTTGLNDVCAYSINGPAAVERDWEYLNTWIDQGYAIVASDYVGLGTEGPHPYLNGKVEAHSVVDAVKAAHSYFPELAGKWAVLGQSQGGGAAMFVARYADEFGGSDNGLSYRGAVATGVPAYIEDVLPAVFHPGALPISTVSPNLALYELYIISGLRASFPEWDINSYLTDYGKEWVDIAEGPLCDTLPGSGKIGIGDAITEDNFDTGRVFQRPLTDIPGFRTALKEYMGIPESGYSQPLFLAQGGLDADVGTGANVLAARLSLNKQPVEYKFYPTKDHSSTVNASKEYSIPFVTELFADAP